MTETSPAKNSGGALVLGLSIGCVAAVIVASVFLLRKNVSYFNPGDFGPIFGTASSVILLGMFGLYRYAHKFYGDNFYQFMSVGWLSNAIYIFFETFFKPPSGDFTYNVEVYLVGLLTSLPFYFASFVNHDDNSISYRDLALSVGGWMLWLIITLVGSYWLVMIRYPGVQEQTKFAVLTFGGIPFAMWGLIRAGRALRTRLDRDIHREWTFIFPWTFYVYAGFQPLYLLKLVPILDMFLRFVFNGALLIKIINSISALSIIRLDTAKVQQRLEQKSVLEDIGALTASIEHDIKNPLEVIDKELKHMRNRFQANDEVVAMAKRLDEQRMRIFAATQIIPVLRGERDFYEQFMQKTSVVTLINACIKAVRKEFNTQNIMFKFDEDRELHVRAYRPMLEQAVVNVLRNAVEAIREAGRENGVINIELRIDRASEDNRMIRIDFQDNGCGIPEEHLSEVAKLFMSTRTKKKPNSGIGLFITKRILKFHNGRLDIRNNDGTGVTVSIFLPRWQE